MDPSVTFLDQELKKEGMDKIRDQQTLRRRKKKQIEERRSDSIRAMAAIGSCCSLSLAYRPQPFRSSLCHNNSSNNGGFSILSRHCPFKTLAFSSNLSISALPMGMESFTAVAAPSARRSVVCEAAPAKKADSAEKRARQSEKRRVYNKARKSEIKTRMKKVLEELDVLRKRTEAQPEEILPIEKLIAEAYSTIDKAVKVGTLHRNTGAHRKSRLARRKKAVEIHHGWYTPAASVSV